MLYYSSMGARHNLLLSTPVIKDILLLGLRGPLPFSTPSVVANKVASRENSWWDKGAVLSMGGCLGGKNHKELSLCDGDAGPTWWPPP